MAGMVIVNNPGDWAHVYPPLLHAQWNGWTPTDLIFPYFLFMVGITLTLSRTCGGSWARIFRRAALIIGLGLFLNGFPFFHLSTIRIPGVLQRIGVCYLVAAALFRATAQSGEGHERRRAAIVFGSAIALLIGYWVVMTQWPIDGRTGDLSPNGNVGAHIDRALFGAHLWSSSKTWDPEGLLSTFPAIATTLLGILAGLWLRAPVGAGRKALVMAAAGVGAIAVGLAWNPLFPINKNLWTSSYVVFTAGMAAVMLAACYALIDVAGYRVWSWPFIVLGSNAIVLYVLSGLIAKSLIVMHVINSDGTSTPLKTVIYDRYFAPIASPVSASLLFALTNLAVLFVILLWLYRRRWFLRV